MRCDTARPALARRITLQHPTPRKWGSSSHSSIPSPIRKRFLQRWPSPRTPARPRRLIGTNKYAHLAGAKAWTARGGKETSSERTFACRGQSGWRCERITSPLAPGAEILEKWGQAMKGRCTYAVDVVWWGRTDFRDPYRPRDGMRAHTTTTTTTTSIAISMRETDWERGGWAYLGDLTGSVDEEDCEEAWSISNGRCKVGLRPRSAYAIGTRVLVRGLSETPKTRGELVDVGKDQVRRSPRAISRRGVGEEENMRLAG
ncbi:hypothetical protein GGS23DRAFT_387369 [Durotheca rogersii]|uniref:uncharacterized protein n=1 Tax=Durotheca rogersii TaxID=419775 RepID=UPI00221FB4A4|nr:uncharacterized protein GGS23DRAFT_387369 [Durotheca rogersii]KAI5857317.1 hypothetical protein GGS23DRAFT_387369 [Durotheca rogersii]